MNSGPEVDANLETADRLLTEAVNAGTTLAVLPENFSVMPADDCDRLQAAEPPGMGPVQQFLSERAARLGVWIVGGTVPMVAAVADKVRAVCLIYDDHGVPVARYDKMHLFDVEVSDQEGYRESDYIEPGPVDGNTVTVDTPVGRLGLTVCYDLRFPELYRALSVAGAQIYAVPSAFTETTGKAHWEVLLRARAVENQAYVVAAAQVGVHANGRRTHGHSMLVGPSGEVLDRVDEGAGWAVADVDVTGLQRLRARFPALTHRRL